MYFASKKSIIPYLLSPEIGSLQLSFKSWGGYYAVVDWVVGEHIVKGTQKTGIVFRSDLDWQGVHGSTNDTDIFNEIKDLKNVNTIDTIGELDGETYLAVKQTKVSNGTKFYKIDANYKTVNCPPINKLDKNESKKNNHLSNHRTNNRVNLSFYFSIGIWRWKIS